MAVNSAWNLVNFRAGLIRSLVAQGYEVVAVAPYDEYAPRLKKTGCRYVSLSMDNKGVNPGRDLVLWWRFFRLFWRERPDVYLGYTVKPNVYGSLAAHTLGIPVINNISGLGAVFIRGGWLASLVRRLYRLALARSKVVFFQNEDDRQLFVKSELVRFETSDRLPGSGIDLVRFSVDAISSEVSPNMRNRDKGDTLTVTGKSSAQVRFRFLLVARMLWDKGVGEYVEAGRLIRERWPNVEFCLLGPLGVQNPAAVSSAQMEMWVAEGVVKYLGVSDDVRFEIATSDCVVLPSYREGTPRTLLEAAAMGSPIITTDAVGCREVVDDCINGYLCKVGDAGDLANKMTQMLMLSDEARAEMGRCGRVKIEREFDEGMVIEKYLQAVSRILKEGKLSG